MITFVGLLCFTWKRLWRNDYHRKKMDTVIQVQILNEAVCVSHFSNTLGKSMNPTIFSPAMCKIVGQTGFFILGMDTSLRERKLWTQNC